MFDNMLQLMRFSVYFKGILNTNNGYFPIKIIISAAHMLGGSWTCSLGKFLKKKCNLVRFDVSLHTILGPPDKFLRMLYAALSGPFLSFLAYGGSLRSVSSLMEASILMSFFILYGGPSDHFFAYYIGAPDHFLRLLYGAPQISFFLYNIVDPLRSVSLFTICPPPPPQISFFAFYREGPPQIDFSFFTKYMGAPSD